MSRNVLITAGTSGIGKAIAMTFKVNTICPWSVEGERLEKVIEAEVKSKGMTRDKIYKAYTEGTSMKKLIHPNDIADMAFFYRVQSQDL